MRMLYIGRVSRKMLVKSKCLHANTTGGTIIGSNFCMNKCKYFVDYSESKHTVNMLCGYPDLRNY